MTRLDSVPTNVPVVSQNAHAFAGEITNASAFGQTRVAIDSSTHCLNSAGSYSSGSPMQASIDSSSSPQSASLLIPVAEVAQLLGVAVRTVWRMASANEIVKPIRLRGNVRWNRRELEAWVEAGCPVPAGRRAK